jgi:UDP-N-acetylmuramoyl-L-alanyl-D-glutamate--2,6-diaminopimelate ligase
MKLESLLKSVADAKVLQPSSLPDTDITLVTSDSRKVTQGTVFIALEGGKTDGHLFLEQSAKAGAAALVIKQGREEQLNLPSSACVITVPDPRKAIAELSAALHDFPGQKLRMVGVTGTNGKTTVTHLIERMLSDQGEKTGLIGTLGQKTNSQKAFDETGHTTPMASELQEILDDMRSEGTSTVVMEVSSHALEQYRVHTCNFSVAVLTNLTQDHLDYHKTMEQYWQAKALLFSRLQEKDAHGKSPTAIINLDSAYAAEFIAACPKYVNVVTYAIDAPNANVSVKGAQYSTAGSTFTVHTPAGDANVQLKLGGRFSVYNALAALAAGLALGVSLEDAVRSLEAVSGIPGRFEAVATNPYVLVDYAHTPDGLQNVLQAAKAILPDKGRLIAVFGCGGDRDATKRPKMGRIAEELADHLVITSDNPRSEDPQQILTDIISGIKRFDSNRMTVDADRLQAIRYAIDMAKQEDIVVVAGKGHEDYQILADRTIHFDDREVVRDYVSYKYAGQTS